ncbi:MAG: hypothetical protein KatS3mg038_0618 [Candidatus Kapaibacterium sp.]|nr:MAG: hypothetical protein KatS3mg038_0618 [Candidatus Kapabacteria bacterium]
MNGVPNRYLLDTSVFIEAFRRYYSFDIAPGFWNALIAHADSVFSIDRVRDEINKNRDDLSKWANNNFSPLI